MKLSECTIGQIVETSDGHIGHIVGLTYNIAVQHTGNLSTEELRYRTIPVVRFPTGELPIHYGNLKIFKD